MSDTLWVLLVEDNPGDARLIAEVLKERSATGVAIALSTEATLAEGLSTIDAAAPEVVLLDLGLPDSQGRDTLRAVHARAPNLPIVVLTGSSLTKSSASRDGHANRRERSSTTRIGSYRPLQPARGDRRSGASEPSRQRHQTQAPHHDSHA